MKNSNYKNDTFPKLLKRNYERYGSKKIALCVKDYGIWEPFTWKDYYENVKYFCQGLVSLGLKQGDKVAILGETKPQAYWAELATHAMRGVAVGIFADCLPTEIKFYITHSDARFVVAHDQEQVDKLLSIKNSIPLVKKIIYWDPKGLWSLKDEILISFDEVMELGKKFGESKPNFFESIINEGDGDDIAIITYTSGTTGEPKGAMLSHKCLLFGGAAWARIDKWGDSDQYVSFLPLAWVAEQDFFAASLLTGMVVNFPESVETVQEDIRETGPTVLFWGARNWESVNRLIQAKIADTTFFNRFLYTNCLKIGYKIADTHSVGNKLPFIWKVLKGIVYWVVFKSLRDRVGLLRVKYAYTAGAPISPDVVRYFGAIGVPIKVGYGASEFPIISSHRDGDIKAGTSGPPLPEVEVKIAENGEILAKGDYKFSGYYKAPVSYEEKVKNGWLQTGDFGHLRDDRHLVVMDRMQDLRRLRNGTQFSPQFIESRLRFSAYIKDVLIIGDVNRDYVGAIVNVDLDNAGRWAERRKIAYTTIASLSQHTELIDLIKTEIVKVNELLPEESRIRRFAILHKEFDPDEAELTRTRKVKRDFMEQRYLSIIGGIYSEKNIVDVESEVVYRDGRRGMQRTEIKITTVF